MKDLITSRQPKAQQQEPGATGRLEPTAVQPGNKSQLPVAASNDRKMQPSYSTANLQAASQLANINISSPRQPKLDVPYLTNVFASSKILGANQSEGPSNSQAHSMISSKSMAQISLHPPLTHATTGQHATASQYTATGQHATAGQYTATGQHATAGQYTTTGYNQGPSTPHKSAQQKRIISTPLYEKGSQSPLQSTTRNQPAFPLSIARAAVLYAGQQRHRRLLAAF